MAYPAIMFLCWIFPTINRIHNAADEAHPSLTLYILMWVFMNLNGAANAFVYGMNDNMQREFRKCCGRGDTYEEGDDENDDGDPEAPLHVVVPAHHQALPQSSPRRTTNDGDGFHSCRTTEVDPRME